MSERRAQSAGAAASAAPYAASAAFQSFVLAAMSPARTWARSGSAVPPPWTVRTVRSPSFKNARNGAIAAAPSQRPAMVSSTGSITK